MAPETIFHHYGKSDFAHAHVATITINSGDILPSSVRRARSAISPKEADVVVAAAATDHFSYILPTPPPPRLSPSPTPGRAAFMLSWSRLAHAARYAVQGRPTNSGPLAFEMQHAL